MANKDFKVKNGLDVSTPIPVSMGGTGQTSTANTLNSLLPSQSGNSNKVLSTDGTNTTWAAQAVAYQRGGTASRPASPTAGDLYYNTDYNYFESYTANGWFPIAAAPGIPTGVTATNQGTSRAFNNGQMSVAFTAATTGGAPTSFILTPNPATSPTTFTGSTSPIVVTGLSSSTQYTHTVVSTSPYGTSAASSGSSAVTATTVPQAPSLVATGLSETTASIAITAGSTGGSAITGYSITSNPTTTTQTTSSSPYTFTGLTTGTAYTFTAYASNALGDSATSTASNSITPAPSGNYYSIASYTVPSDTNSVVEFSSIDQTYKDLVLIVRAGATYAGSGGGSGGKLYFNNDTTSKYAWSYLNGNGNGQSGGVTSAGVGPTTQFDFGASWAGNANAWTSSIFIFQDYTNTSKMKNMRNITGLYCGNGTNSGTTQYNGTYNSLSPITSIQLVHPVGYSDGSFRAGSQIQLFGIKG